MSPFDAAISDVDERLDGALELLQTVNSTQQNRPIMRAKGLVFVEMFAAYEPTVRNSVLLYLTAVRDANLEVAKLHPGLQSLLRDQEIQSIAASKKKQWVWRSTMLSQLQSGNTSGSRVDAFPDNGDYYRRSQLDLIWDLLQLPGSPVPSGRISPLVGEIISNRNAIAHGRERPEDIGRRLTIDEAEIKIRQAKDLCRHILAASENGATAAIAHARR